MKGSSNKWSQWLPRWINKHFKNQAKLASYFVHIPKTAGTSFIVLLDRFYPADKIFPHQLWRETKGVDLSINNEFELFRGHFGGGGVSVLTQLKLDYLTILREPQSLAKSTYQFVQRESNTKVHQLLRQNQMSFADFLKHPMTTPLVKNRLIRNISFDFKADPAAQEVFLSAETIQYLQDIIEQQKTAINDDQRLQRAKKFVKGCRWFGLLERFNESMQLLCYVMHWPPLGVTQKLNTHKNQLAVSREETDLLKQINQQDMIFYEWAKGVFEQKMAAMIKDLNKLKSNDTDNIDALLDKRYQQHHAKQNLDALPNSVTYGFDQVLLGSQWHRREMMQPENEYFRWTGPGHYASIDFWIQPGNYEITLRIINATSVSMLEQLKFSLNGHEIPWYTDDSGLVRVLHLQCQSSLIQDNGLARLGIQCSQMVSHRQAFESNDERLVGIAIHWIQFNHVK